MSEISGVLSPDAEQFICMVAGSPGLAGSHIRILWVLREVCTSPRYISDLTKIAVPRVRQRLKELEKNGYVTILETLSDNTNIWAMAPNLRKPDAPMHPTEAFIAERRLKQSALFDSEYDPTVTEVWGGPDGVIRPRNPAKVDSIDVRAFKQYEAKVNK